MHLQRVYGLMEMRAKSNCSCSLIQSCAGKQLLNILNFGSDDFKQYYSIPGALAPSQEMENLGNERFLIHYSKYQVFLKFS